LLSEQIWCNWWKENQFPRHPSPWSTFLWQICTGSSVWDSFGIPSSLVQPHMSIYPRS
jgi:hypothetical protein